MGTAFLASCALNTTTWGPGGRGGGHEATQPWRVGGKQGLATSEFMGVPSLKEMKTLPKVVHSFWPTLLILPCS